ncbi:hypothetical protein KVR01_000943 [Diaporthe batatas]|uniref:uncharacterized protein n=1 Tax=Diaporthe batatas TaxID=748121 RepID=UPI001D047DF0|nr:uncharacterized protein KVR01_000943 [Diaporthe batatas]KAG8170198.1 hypothetical protein KVR01_000943 [Diaporthe batatas]
MTIDRTTLLGFVPGVSDEFYNLPILRLFRSGKAMVRIFFVLSGYALSLSPASHLDQPASAGRLQRRLAVAALKRPLRLFLPPLATTFVVLLSVLAGLFPTARSLGALPAHLLMQTVARKSSAWAQALDWVGFVTHKLVNPWDWVENLYAGERDSYYGPHLWTIQTEFRCSMILFSVLAGISALRRPAARHLVVGLLTVYAGCWGRWDVALFFAGMHLCIIDTARQRRDTDALLVTVRSHASGQATQKGLRRREVLLRVASRAAPSSLLFVGLWTLSYPDDKADQALGFVLLSRVCSSPDFWQSLGAVSVLWSTSRLQVAKRQLCSAPLQYLGSLSFSLYLVHYPFLEIMGWHFYLLCREYVASASIMADMSPAGAGLVGNLFGFVTITPVLLWLSDLTMRLLDLPTQGLVSWLVKSLCLE